MTDTTGVSGWSESIAAKLARLAAERLERERIEQAQQEAARQAALRSRSVTSDSGSSFRSGRTPAVDLGNPGGQPVESPPAGGGVPKGEAAQYDYFRQMIEDSGGKFKIGPGERNLIGFRKEDKTTANGGNGEYNDVLAMLWQDASGKPHVKLYTYNSEPQQTTDWAAADVNGDGSADMGRIPVGHYQYDVSTWKNGQPCLRAREDFRVQRDMDHDGDFDENRMTDGGASMLFHLGGSSKTGSAGCQTFAPGEWERFWSDVRGAKGSIGYTLVEGTPEGITEFVPPPGTEVPDASTGGSPGGGSSGTGSTASGGGGGGGVPGGGGGGRSTTPVNAEPGSQLATAESLAAERYGQGSEIFSGVLQALMELSDAERRALGRNNPELKKFIRSQPGMSGWQPGQPVPPDVLAAFFSQELGALGAGGLKAGELDQAFATLLGQSGSGTPEPGGSPTPGQGSPDSNGVVMETAAPASPEEASLGTPPVTAPGELGQASADPGEAQG